MSEIIAQARALLATSQPEKALEILSPHIQANSSSPEFLSILGETLLENNQLEEAYQVLTSACEIDPEANQGSEKFLYLGQIIGGQDGLNYINTGLNKLNEQLSFIQDTGNEDVQTILVGSGHNTLESLRKWIIKKLNSGIFASIEIWMTDLCMEEEAESKCNELIEFSLSIDPLNPEAYSQLSSIRISQQRNDEANEALNKGWDLFKAKKTKLEDFANLKRDQAAASVDTETEVDDEDAFEIGMEYVELIQPLITLSKFAIELEEYDTATDIASNVQDINDSVLDAIYIEAIANIFKAKKLGAANISQHANDDANVDYRDFEILKLRQTSDDNEEITNLLSEARLILTTGFKIINSDAVDDYDPSVVEQVNDLLNQLGGPIMSELMPKRESEKDDEDVDWENEIEYEE